MSRRGAAIAVVMWFCAMTAAGVGPWQATGAFAADVAATATASASTTPSSTAIAVTSTPGTPEAAREAYSIFAGAEERYQAPSETWFAETQAALRAEVDRVGGELDSHRECDATYWKSHLRWELLERNLGPASTVNLRELEEVRRWMYSNRKGLESPFFAPLRAAMDAYLDAAFTLLQPDLQAAFNDHVAIARRQCLAVGEDPCDATAAALGRTLAWFERTGQLADEIAAVRALTSLPNAQIVLDGELISRIVGTQTTPIEETIPVAEEVEIPPANPLQRSRTMKVRGTATTNGRVQIELTPNDKIAELALVYQGTVESTARGETGPVTIRLTANGTAHAVKPIYFSPAGLELGKTMVVPHVTSRVAAVDADNAAIEWIAKRRSGQPDSQALMNAKARSTTIVQLGPRLDQRVEEGLAKIRSDIGKVRSGMSDFGDITAPLTREGVKLYFEGARSTESEIDLNAFSRRREQHGAAAPCPVQSIVGDVLVRVHVSFVNNMAETITGGKTLSDEFVMKYAKVLHAELPLPLMVHSRAKRWALTMAKLRPIEVRIPDANRFEFVVRIDAVDVDGVTYTAPTTAKIEYQLRQDHYGEYQLERDGGVQMETSLPAETGAFVQEKLGAFFGPVLSSGGVVIPEGGFLGALKHLQSKGVHAEHEWIVAGWDVPAKVVEEFIKASQPREELASLGAGSSQASAGATSNATK